MQVTEEIYELTPEPQIDHLDSSHLGSPSTNWLVGILVSAHTVLRGAMVKWLEMVSYGAGGCEFKSVLGRLPTGNLSLLTLQ